MTSPMSRLLSTCAASLLLFTASAKIVTHNFTATWVMANPDGMMERRVIGINGEWPLPLIEVDMGDNVVVNLHNDLGDQSTSLHFHGLYQNGTTHMDGPVAVSQCAVAPGSSFTYNFTIDQPGTYWYHSHVKGQYPDGLRGPVIVHDPTSPYLDQFDEEMVMTLSDWYHDEMPPLLKSFMSVSNPTGAEPVPNSALMNDRQNTPFNVQPGKTYLIHIVNMAAFASQYLWFEDHTMEIVEVDGIWTERAEANMIYVAPAQRYSILLKTKDNIDQNFAIVGSMDEDLFDAVPPGLNPNVTGYLVYDESKPMPIPKKIHSFEPHDDFNLIPADREELWNDPVQTWTLDMKMDNLGDGANYAFFNDITWVAPKVPTLYTALTTGQDAMNPKVYGINTNSFTLGHNEVFEMVLNSVDPGKHPFHLHGHTFQTLVRADDDAGAYDPTNHTAFPAVPMRRDTLLVRPNSHFVIRFRSDNPGVWLFHCHLEWHVASGLIATIVEAPLELQKQLSIDTLPADHIQACRDSNTPMYGNAAGNTLDFLDLSGQNLSPAPLPDGFEPRGIVALTFSIVAALLGMAAVAWYGAKPLSEKEEQREEEKMAVGLGASVSRS